MHQGDRKEKFTYNYAIFYNIPKKIQEVLRRSTAIYFNLNNPSWQLGKL